MKSVGGESGVNRLRGFWALIVTQFQGAFSDNVYRTLAMFMVIGMTLPHIPGASRELKMSLVWGLFSIPFILLSMTGGYLADRFSKRHVVIGTKLAEIAIMCVALAALYFREPWMILATVFLMGGQSALFGPSKYGLLPELLTPHRLSWGNGIIELGTFMAIITGTIAGGWLFISFVGSEWWSGVVLVGLACLGLTTSFGIDRLPPADSGKRWRANFIGDLWSQLMRIRHDRVLTLAIAGNTYFIFLAALIQQYTVIAYGQDLLGLNEGQITLYLMAPIAVGIGIGSFSAGYLSGNKIEYGLIPLGALGMTVIGIFLSLPGRSIAGATLLLGLYGFSAGFFVVPISALIQHRPDRDKKGATIATSSMLSFVGIFLASGAWFLLAGILKLNPLQIFAVTTLLIFGGTLYALWLLPDALIRLVLFLLTRTLYRIRVEGRENIPEKGGALFVCNHLSQVDALLLQSSTDRPIRFMAYQGLLEKPLVGRIARLMKTIPISSQYRPRDMIQSLRTASEAIRNGEVVCIFAEGQITRIGQMLPFRRGFQRIMKGLQAPIIPVCLDGVWGSIFSFEKKRFYWKLPRRIPYPVTVSYGQPLPSTASHIEVRQVVQELAADAWQHRRARMDTLDRAIIRTARTHPFRFCMADARFPHLSFGKALVQAVYMARRLRPAWEGQDKVGLYLPPSVGGALANLAAFLCGKVPVNLNYTLSAEGQTSCSDQSGLQTVLTSRKFLEKVKLNVPARVVFIEDLVSRPRVVEKLIAFCLAHLVPVRIMERLLGHGRPSRLDELATVIFSSGSTGDPKGVMLSHYNIMSNVEQLEQLFAVDSKDRFLGILPFFHSFGFTGTFCLPLVVGTGVAYHPNPLDAPGIGQLVRAHALTFMVATPTFLQVFMRGCEPGDLGSLRYVVAGAEKLPERLADAFEDRFGIRPLEGYGCTECAPAVAINTLDFRAAGFRQVGGKRGRIGHPLPGMSVRIVDETTYEPRPLGEPGLMLLKGPNVMTGYLNRPEKTDQVLRDGWYITGDMASLDEDGFLKIEGRLSRFSKIGGEMVPHLKVEDALHELAGKTEQAFVVTAVPDQKKGERLVVLHTLPEEELQECVGKLLAADLPNLWKPKPDAFFHQDQLPYLGSGKLDLKAVNEIAAQLASGRD